MKSQHPSEKHQFALFYTNLSGFLHSAQNKSFSLTDPNLVHRITSILRLGIGESLVLFDQSLHAQVTIADIVKHKSIRFELDYKKHNLIYKPEITVLLPLLKKDSFETALYSLAEIGVTTIQLLITHKSQQRWTPKDQERAQKILIAAAEQSKNFALPTLKTPLNLHDFLKESNTFDAKIFFDPVGILLSQTLQKITQPKHIALAIGPEGDLINEEKELLRSAGFVFSSLTPTILRACQAAALGAGIIRSFHSS